MCSVDHFCLIWKDEAHHEVTEGMWLNGSFGKAWELLPHGPTLLCSHRAEKGIAFLSFSFHFYSLHFSNTWDYIPHCIVPIFWPTRSFCCRHFLTFSVVFHLFIVSCQKPIIHLFLKDVRRKKKQPPQVKRFPRLIIHHTPQWGWGHSVVLVKFAYMVLPVCVTSMFSWMRRNCSFTMK